MIKNFGSPLENGIKLEFYENIRWFPVAYRDKMPPGAKWNNAAPHPTRCEIIFSLDNFS